jgi:hypothetical protein
MCHKINGQKLIRVNPASFSGEFMTEDENEAEDHGAHLCVDEIVSTIKEYATKIEKIWTDKDLTCKIVKDAGLISARDILSTVIEVIGV